jgi:type VI secretion system protein
MALRLRVVSDHRRSLGDRSSIVFGVGGGTIGRSADNDWVLPDPLRYVSAHHARVSFRNGDYLLEDLSTNGVFVNDSEQAIGKVGPHRLNNGDLVRFGAYEVAVVVETEVAAHAEAPRAGGTRLGAARPDAGRREATRPEAARPEATRPEALRAEAARPEPARADPVDAPSAMPTSIHALRGVGRPSQTDIGAALNLDELLVPDGSSPSGGYRPVNAYGQAISMAPRSTPATTPIPAPPPEPEPDEEAIARRIARLAKAAGRDPKNGASLPALYDVQTGLQAFARGAGIEAEKLPGDAQTRLLHLAGQLFREALVGLKDLEGTRHEIRNRFRIELPVDADDPRPSFARMTVEELVVELFQQHEIRRLDAVQWLREAMSTAKEHENATAHAMRAAFVEFLDRLDPAEMEARFERAARRGKAGSGRAQYWDMFTEFYRNLIEMPANHLPHTFVEAFAQAYKEFLKKPV